MLLPLEIALLMAGTGVSLVMSAMRPGRSGMFRVTSVLAGLGALTFAIGGRLSLPTGGSATTRLLVPITFLALSVALSMIGAATALVRRVRRGRQAPRNTE